MQNYIQILGQRIELTDEQVEEIRKGIADDKVTLGSIPEGETCKIGEYEFIVLNHNTDSTEILLKGLLREEEKFGTNNNFDGSDADKLCDTFYEVIADAISNEHKSEASAAPQITSDFNSEICGIAGIVGKDAFEEHVVDLTSDDGLKDYGEVRRKMSLLTTEQYRQYVDILDEYKPDKWWWLATPHSTDRHENSSWVKCVSPFGFMNADYCNNVNGVRPFCILQSNIYVSK